MFLMIERRKKWGEIYNYKTQIWEWIESNTLYYYNRDAVIY